MNNRILTMLLLIFCSTHLFSQTAADALRFSQFDFGGTARAVGSGSALGALGSDFSALSVNPAGLGWYRRSEFVFTPGIASSGTTSRLLNSEPGGLTEDNRSAFNLASLGTVIASNPRSQDWTTFNFAIGFNRVADFNQRFFFQGNSQGSIVNRFQEIANSGAGLGNFESRIAHGAEAIYDFDNTGVFNSDFELAPNAIINRNQTVINRGSMSELGISISGNYKERVLLGVTVGLPFISFTEEKVYRESDPNNEVPFFESLEYRERLTTTGVGINLKAGIIVRPHQALRLGAAVHTPTTFRRLEDNYRTAMDYNYVDDGQFFQGRDSLDGIFQYRLRTPWRYIGSAGLIVGKTGFLSAEAEWVDYSNNRFTFTNLSFSNDERIANDSITATLSQAVNIRLGGELAYEIFRFRAGLGLHGSPYAGVNDTDTSYSFGLGIREQSFYIDLAFRRRQFGSTYLPYRTSQAPMQVVNNQRNSDQFLLTFGFRF
ncbi:MAG TPA: hypothetical protein PKC76_14685 [Saprospiraceae bacterium]|nr:hypothetical protein [Saprospiraceae bacterium]HMP25378.1 hypothetical protein [Saprospiraceae bacterium]